MKTIKSILNSVAIVGFLSISQFSFAQNINQKSTNIVVSGTSTMHDWTMDSKTSTFTGTVAGNAITNVKFSTPVKALVSTKGKMMDNKAHKALNIEKAPNITFTATSMNVGKSTVTGKLSIAGVTKTISLPVTITKKGNDYVIDATETVKMSDYGMERPGALGMKAGDEVKIKINIVAQ